MCCRKMVKHSIKNIFIGWYNYLFHPMTKEAKARLAICEKCEYNVNGVCDICGCVLKAKASAPNEICHAGKWPA